MHKPVSLALTLALLGAPALAAPRTITLSVPGMTCPVCPITVQKSLKKVNGVTRVEVSFDERTAVVVYDDARTSIEALTQATANAGYPSAVKTNDKAR
ncbi:MAG: mercury resistance system periplasmic binding protein MerP [Bryobacteraceae bacterium]|mgnify:CR=1 FL=1|nr:mercury resistance system periplasmic binding protein MerP [Bryobacteraceae bacterium]